MERWDPQNSVYKINVGLGFFFQFIGEKEAWIMGQLAWRVISHQQKMQEIYKIQERKKKCMHPTKNDKASFILFSIANQRDK